MAEHGGPGGGGGGDQSWRTPAFRHKIVAQIDEAIRQCSNPISRNSAEMENHVYHKAKTKDEYLSFVARLILHIREMNSSNKQIASSLPPNQPGMPIGPGSNPDPINALQSLARQEVPLTYFPGATQLGAALTNQSPHLGSALANQNPQLGAALSNQAPVGPGPGIGMGVNLGGQVMQGQGIPQGGLQNLIGGVSVQQRQQMPLNVNAMPPGSHPMTKVQMKQQAAQQKQMQHMQAGHSPQPSTMPPPTKPGTPLGQLQPGMGDNMMMRDPNHSVGPGQFVTQNVPPMPRQGTPTQFLHHSPGSGQVSGHGGMVPSPAQQIPPSMAISQMAPSPGYLPSQSPQIINSPAPSVSSQMGRTPGTVGAPSPGSALNTPATIGPVPSPASRSLEDQAYLEKVKQLSKYIEPLKRMITRIDKDEDKKKEQSKMKNLLDILSNPSKRLPMDTLLKCEQVLEKLELKVKPSDPTVMLPSTLPPPGLQGKDYNICQPLLDAVVSHLNSPTFSHTLQRTFAPAVAVLHGTSFRSISPPLRRSRQEQELDIPDVLQGEIARLDRRFKVNLDPIQNSGSKTVHLICQLDDKNLPCVPPIMVAVPMNYPQKAPRCETSSEEYESTQFLQKIHRTLSARLSNMPDNFSITSLLDTWEMSVRQACSLAAAS